MIKKVFVPFLLVLLFASCSSTISLWHADSNMRKISIGMTKEQVISVMGKHYESVAATHQTEVIGYKSSEYEIYILQFENNKLIEWHKEWLQRDRIAPTETSLHKQKDNSGTKFHLDAHRNAMLSTASSDSQKAHINIHMDAVEKSMLDD